MAFPISALVRRALGAVMFRLRDPQTVVFRANDPSFLIIGAQKAGTTTLYQLLLTHPEIRGAVAKELHYFNRDMYRGATLADYRGSFRGRARFHFEATPAYVYHPGVAEAVARHYPQMKLILILRDPVRRALSAYNMYRDHFQEYREGTRGAPPFRHSGNRHFDELYVGRSAPATLRECIDIELGLMRDSPEIFEPGILRRGLYAEQIRTWWQHFDKRQLRIVGLQEFTTRPAALLAELCDFIGASPVDWSRITRTEWHRRSYDGVVFDPADVQFLEDFYAEPNRELFEMIGPVAW